MLDEPPIDLPTACSDADLQIAIADLDPSTKRQAKERGAPLAARPAKSAVVETYAVEIASPTLRRLWNEPDHSEAAEKLYRLREGLGPLLEPVPHNDSDVLVTVLYKGDKDTRSVIMSGGPTDFEGRLTRFGRTHLWFLSAKVPKISRFAYTFEEEVFSVDEGVENVVRVVDLTDELNPELTSNGLSMLVLPLAPPLPLIEKRSRELPIYEIDSRILNERRRYALYTPPGGGDRELGMAVFFDGEAFASGWPAHEVGPFVDMPAVLDHLISGGKIPPIVAAFVHVEDRRDADLTGDPRYADFIGLELLPSLRCEHARITDRAERTIVAGSSLGGVCAVTCAMRHSAVIGNVLSVSGSFWLESSRKLFLHPFFGEGLIQTAIMASPRLPIRFYLDVGSFEGQSCLVVPNRHVRDILLAKGYRVTYSETPGNHDYMRWHTSMSEGLIELTNDWD